MKVTLTTILPHRAQLRMNMMETVVQVMSKLQVQHRVDDAEVVRESNA